MVNIFRGTLMEKLFSKVILTVEENLKVYFCFNLRSNMLNCEFICVSTNTKFSIEVIWMKIN